MHYILELIERHELSKGTIRRKLWREVVKAYKSLGVSDRHNLETLLRYHPRLVQRLQHIEPIHIEECDGYLIEVRHYQGYWLAGYEEQGAFIMTPVLAPSQEVATLQAKLHLAKKCSIRSLKSLLVEWLLDDKLDKDDCAMLLLSLEETEAALAVKQNWI